MLGSNNPRYKCGTQEPFGVSPIIHTSRIHLASFPHLAKVLGSSLNPFVRTRKLEDFIQTGLIDTDSAVRRQCPLVLTPCQACLNVSWRKFATDEPDSRIQNDRLGPGQFFSPVAVRSDADEVRDGDTEGRDHLGG